MTRARPQFWGHYQPHLPSDLGFCDLRLPEVREEQANLAREYGIHGFCYYHYWFNGERMLDRVFNEVLESGKPDFPFCLCWANETWTKTWAGKDGEILREQKYSTEDDRRHIQFLIKAFKDERYIKVNGRPLFLIYRAKHIEGHLPEMLPVWKEELDKAGIPEPYLCAVSTPPTEHFEATVDFFPSDNTPTTLIDKAKFNLRKRIGINVAKWRHKIIDYSRLVDSEIAKPSSEHKRFLCPVPNWDNSPRKAATGSLILNNSTPAEFGRWFEYCVRETMQSFDGEERIVFVNAWNEWAEGTHLEPDQRWGRGYLEAIRKTLEKYKS